MAAESWASQRPLLTGAKWCWRPVTDIRVRDGLRDRADLTVNVAVRSRTVVAIPGGHRLRSTHHRAG